MEAFQPSQMMVHFKETPRDPDWNPVQMRKPEASMIGQAPRGCCSHRNSTCPEALQEAAKRTVNSVRKLSDRLLWGLAACSAENPPGGGGNLLLEEAGLAGREGEGGWKEDPHLSSCVNQGLELQCLTSAGKGGNEAHFLCRD